MDERFYKKLYINRKENGECDIHCLYANGADSRVSREEIHNYYAIIFFISGEAELVSEFGQQTFQPNTAVLLPPNTYFKLIINEEKMLYKRVVLSFYQIPELSDLINAKFKEFALFQSDELTHLFMQIIGLYDSKYTTIERDALCKSFFMQILVNFDINSRKKNKTSSRMNPIVKETISYINENLDRPISINDLSQRQNISRSTLTAIFKKEMNISIYSFILTKRLNIAAEKISKGEKPTQVALDCGFNDYSGFYKQYKKMFKISPSSPLDYETIIKMQ